MSTKKTVYLECKYLGGYYPKAMKVKNSTTGLLEGRELKFINGRTQVSEEELAILKQHEKWGSEFGEKGTLGQKAIARQVEVKKGVSPTDQIREQLLAQGHQKLALKPEEQPETDEQIIARLAAEHDETSGAAKNLAGTEGKSKRLGKTGS
jgi:hypothetical protein